MTKFYNGKIITATEIIENGCILVDGNTIVYVGKDQKELQDQYAITKTINAKGHYISAGFIDIHVHGAGGFDFMDGTAEAFLEIARIHARYGTTSLVPTTLCSSDEELKRTFEIYKEVKQSRHGGASFLGMHLEGPYFSKEQKGAQDEKHMKVPSPEHYTKIVGWSDDIARWSAAPEIDHVIAFGKYITDKGIVASIGHSNATYHEVCDAYNAGFTHITHLYSGMSSVTRENGYRRAGVVESAYLIDGMSVEVIADGHHLPPSLLALIYKIKGPDKIALITDAMRGAGQGDGTCILGSLEHGIEVIVEDGVAKMPDRKAFAGSVATFDTLVRTMLAVNGISLVDAVKMATLTPARIMKVDNKKGSLSPGKSADIIIFDSNIDVLLTMVEGSVVHSRI